MFSNEDKIKGRFTMKLNRTELFFSLFIDDFQPNDSATYLCAVSKHSASLPPASVPKYTEPQYLIEAIGREILCSLDTNEIKSNRCRNVLHMKSHH